MFRTFRNRCWEEGEGKRKERKKQKQMGKVSGTGLVNDWEVNSLEETPRIILCSASTILSSAVSLLL